MGWGETVDDDDTVSRSKHDRPMVRSGESVDRFTLLFKLGRGGMGVVYCAHDPVLDRKIALKILHERRRKRSRARVRFLREAQAMAKIRHPNVVEVFAVAEHDDRVYIAMELVDGDPLTLWTKRRRPHTDRRGWEAAIDVFIQCARGLAAAHDAGLVHRDFKPGNVLVGKDGRARVTDFGLVRLAGPSRRDDPLDAADLVPSPSTVDHVARDDLHLTQTGAQLGTPAYMAPEQLVDPTATDARSDQFSFGVTLYEALYGRLPFTPGAAGFEPPRPPPSGTTVPRWLRRIVDRLIAAAPDRRFDTMRTVIDRLERRGGARRRAVPMAAAGLVFVGTAGAIALPGDDAPTCADAASILAPVTGNARRQAVATAFEAYGAFGRLSYERVSDELDRFEATWSAEVAATCEQRDQLGPRDYDMKMACLRDRATRLGAFLEILADADAGQVEASIRETRALALDPTCAEVDGLGARGTGPIDPQSPEEGRLRRMLGRCEAFAIARRAQDGLPIASEVIEGAREAGLRGLEAQGHLCRARMLTHRGEFARAEEDQTAAFWAATDAGASWVAFDAALAIVDNVGREQARVEEGRAWLRHANAIVERLPAPERVQAALVDADGLLDLEEGRFADAREKFQRELELVNASPESTDDDRLVVYNRLTIVEGMDGRHEQALQWALAGLDAATERFGPSHPELIDGLNNVGMIHYNRGEFEEAVTFHTRAIEIALAHRPEDHPELATYYNNRGMSLAELGRHQEAQAHYDRALELRQRYLGADHPDVARVLGNLANLARDRGDHDDAVRYALQATELLRRSLGSEHPDTLLAILVTGTAHLQAGRVPEARQLLDTVDEVAADTLGPSSPIAESLEEFRTALTEAEAREDRRPPR